MTRLADEPRTVVIGYNTRYGKAGGSLVGFPEDRLWEMPLAENLMLGAAIGAALDGRIPMVWFERADFLFCAMDALVNHLDRMEQLSDGLHNPGVIIRICVGNSKAPLFTGPVHTQNPYEALVNLVKFPVYLITKAKQVEFYYSWALDAAKQGRSTIIIEQKDTYNDP